MTDIGEIDATAAGIVRHDAQGLPPRHVHHVRMLASFVCIQKPKKELQSQKGKEKCKRRNDEDVKLK